MWRNLASNVFNLIGIMLLLLGGAAIWGKSQYYNKGPLSKPICLRVDSGSKMRTLSENLVENTAISNAAIFRIGIEYEGKAGQLKAGNFLIEQESSMASIAQSITQGGPNTCGSEVIYRVGINSTQVQVREMDPTTRRFEKILNFELATDAQKAFEELLQTSGMRHRIALAEGVTSHRVVETINQIEILSGSILDKPLEGSLSPKSYELRQGDDRTALLLKMQVSQTAHVRDAWLDRAEGLPLTSENDALILASIIEKETGLSSERALVASVFINRLNRGMPLQTDPSVIYGITKGEYSLGRGLRKSELSKDTPWNTYLNKGLPPTPISNPGLQSILAAVNPADTEYVYFVADGEGSHAFAKNLKEHNINVAKWRAIEALRKKSQEN
ncbi:MAG: branched-chain alpha-keto acid dehydrogenase subunit E2 [Aestuariivita sp.]|nr:branched-chain alpha-keto acid dehydrogenase subunit E2 [Aestuariivita sp.]